MHEIGHAFGLAHIESSTDRLLMEPFIDTNFDGPQLDDIRGIHGQYGDVFELTNNGLGNDVAARATGLGAISAGATRLIGSDAVGGQSVAATETDFVSIANASDFDFFSFSLSGPSTLDATLTPLGGVFNQAAQGAQQSSFNANARNDLMLSVYSTNGSTLLASANSTAAGFSESLADLSLPGAGQYFVRVSGASSSVQLYQLQLSVASVAEPSADFDGDGDVDGTDFLAWQRNIGGPGAGPAGDANYNGIVDAADLAILGQQFGPMDAEVVATRVPEPAGIQICLYAGLGWLASRRLRLTFRADRYMR